MYPPFETERPVAELFSLRGKTALLTGAAGYLGSAFSRALAEAGASVVAGSRQLARAEEVVASLPTVDGARHKAVVLDQMDDAALKAGFDAALAHNGRIDVLVNNGHEGSGKDLTNVTGDEFSRQLENATGYFLLARLVHDQALAAKRGASIVLIGSMYGVVGSYPHAYKDVCAASPVAYHALKGALVHMTRHLAVYWATEGVRVNCLSPGPFPTPAAPQEMVRRLEQLSPMHRMGVNHEVKGALIFLASDASSYVTGQNLLVDGGWTAW